MTPNEPVVRTGEVESRILFLRGTKVLLDHDLAVLYGVETKNLVKAVKRNLPRFPPDFMFQLTEEEFGCLRFQTGTSNGRGGRRYLPYAFTEQGVAMLSSVLRSERAVRVNIEIMRAFVRLRGMLAAHADLKAKLEELEDKVAAHDDAIRSLVIAIRNLIEGPRRKDTRRIGFLAGGK